MPSDLPPGVSVGDIPGNRPEDEWWERFTEALADELPSWVYEHPVVRVVSTVVGYLQEIERFMSAAYREGHDEGRMEALEEERDRYELERDQERGL